MTKIKLYIDSNELSSDRPEALWAVAEKHPDVFEKPQSRNLLLDFCAVCDGVADWWEFKTIDDLYNSMDNGHLANQIIPVIARENHINLAIFGSLDAVMEQTPDHDGARTPTIIEMERNRLRGLCADLHGDGVRVHFLSENLEDSFAWILSYTKNTLQGGDVCTHLPRPDILQHAMLSLCPGCGPKTVPEIAKHWHFELRPHTVGAPPISEITINGARGPRRFGEKRMKKLMAALARKK